ncbi:MAG: O-methyltransferase [Lachnospiraceae bacterium]|nr:O-methyltransferase [Lachnospiraceae bacterium]
MTKEFFDIRIDDFISSLNKETDEEIILLKKVAIENEVPIIRDETKSFLRMILSIKRPQKILEIGTAIAYSTLVIHRAVPTATIVTIEDFERRIKEAKENIGKFINKDGKNIVTLIEDDATNYLNKISGSEEFDFIFLDAAKAQYINWLPNIEKVLAKDGILIADNIFKDGEILESKFLIKKRDRTIHKRMREFLHEINNNKSFETYQYNIGDGISVSIKK